MLDPLRLRSRVRSARRPPDSVGALSKVREDLVVLRCMLLEMQTFQFRGDAYPYVARDRGNTWRHERAVELPIARQAVMDAGGGTVLEVGHVLRHHFPEMTHRVIDKHEQAELVENIDVMDVEGRFDLIVSVSTLEHVGYDEPDADDTGPAAVGAVEAIAHLRSCLSSGGRLLFTAPIGYNRELDRALGEGIPGLEAHFLRRVDLANRWVESDWRTVAHASYGHPYRNANAIVVGIAHG